MIKLRTTQVPPLYQLDFAHRLVKSDPDAALRLLKAEPLQAVGLVELTNTQDMQSLYMDDVIGKVSRSEERIIKVVYREAMEEYQTERDKLWSSVDFGIKYTSVIDWFHDDDAKNLDLGNLDRRYHIFRYIGHYDVFMIDVDDNTQHTVLVWEDLETSKSYCCEAVLLTMNT